MKSFLRNTLIFVLLMLLCIAPVSAQFDEPSHTPAGQVTADADVPIAVTALPDDAVVTDTAQSDIYVTWWQLAGALIVSTIAGAGVGGYSVLMAIRSFTRDTNNVSYAEKLLDAYPPSVREIIDKTSDALIDIAKFGKEIADGVPIADKLTASNDPNAPENRVPIAESTS